MSRKLIAIVFSDLHLHVYNQFNENNRRLDLGFNILTELASKKVPLLFCGDLFHENSHISNQLLDRLTVGFRLLMDQFLYGISGNHDMSEMSVPERLSPSLFRSVCRFVPNMQCIDFTSASLSSDIMVFGIPYLDYNKGLYETMENIKKSRAYKRTEKRILLIHTDLYGAKDTDGREIGSVENIDRNMGKFFKGFDLVFSGHIHKPQRITPKIVMVGAPMQQRKSDMGGQFGYWELFDDLSYQFVAMKNPEFKLYDPALDEIDNFHYWIPINKQEEYEEEQLEKRFTNNVSRVQLAQRYCKEKGIKSRQRINALKEILND